METVTLGDSGLTTTRLGFGCASIMRSPLRRQREALLATALESGITHFDTARMYGLGAAESELGRFAARRRDRLVIATKFGLGDPMTKRLAGLQAPARAAIARFPALREALRRRHTVGASVYRDYTAGAARVSLTESLRQLRTDYIDLFLIHDPPGGELASIDDVASFLEDARTAGTIRAWGVSGEPEPARALACQFPPETILQVRDNVFTRREHLETLATPTVTFGVLATALSRIASERDRGVDRTQRWSDVLGIDCRDLSSLATLLVADALSANPAGCVLFSTTDTKHVEDLASATNLPVDAQQIAAFRRLMFEDFRVG